MSKAPKLRFKEFSGDWENKKISEIYSDLKAGSTPSKAVPRYFKGNIPWITSGELKTKYIYKTNEYITEEAVKSANLKIYEEGTFFIAITGLEAPGTRGSCAINKVKATTNQSCLAFQKNSKMKNEFLYYWYLLNGEHIGIKYTQGTKQQSLNNELVGKLRINMPSIEEQEKIASFFSLIDDKISLQSEKVEALKDYKKGMMQKIFIRELRFKDDEGRDYPEWEEKKLGDIANLTSSKRVFASDYVDEGIPFYRGKEITELKQNKKPNDILYITQEKYDDIKNNFGIPVKGDLLLTAVGTLGNSYVIKDDNPFYFKDGNLIWFKDIKEDVNFLNFILTSEKGQKKIIDSAIGSTQKALTIVELNKLKYEFPSLKEQRKIAKFLNGLESKVMKEQEKLDFLNEYKKGLLQQMFV